MPSEPPPDALPCPFCGSTKTRSVSHVIGIPGHQRYDTRVECTSCKAVGPKGGSVFGGGGREWNRRVT
jgi:hypothetical protein